MTGYISLIGEMRNTKFCFQNLKEGENLIDLGVHGRTLLECILGKYGGNMRTEFVWIRIEIIGGIL
jgi:hypothetical protein